jgi:tetratricopeptide (TPR) repeat protein
MCQHEQKTGKNNCITPKKALPREPFQVLVILDAARVIVSTDLMSIPEAHNALQNGDFDSAFELLERAARSTTDPQERANLDLEAAGIYALYGRDGLEGGDACLHDAVLSDARSRTNPLYMALRAELNAYALEAEAFEKNSKLEANDPRVDRAMKLAWDARTGNITARFHAGAALVTLGQAEQALECLNFEFQELPEFLRWRAFSWRGGAFEDLQRWREASNTYATAASMTTANDRAALLMDQAAMLLECDEPHEALEVLEATKVAYLSEEPALEAASRLHLEARAHLALENPGVAAERAEAARQLELDAGEPSYGTALVHGQALAQLGEWSAALLAFRAAVERAGPADKSFAQHEMGVAQMDAGELDGARETLLVAARDEEYIYLAEVFADLAEVEYRRGDFDAAEGLAKIALERGATVPASLILANVAYEYFRLDEALGHYCKVLELAPEASRDWVIAHEMIADTLVQDGWRDPQEILEHSQLALPHLEPSDEWVVTLGGYIEKAHELLKDKPRTLN